VKAGISTSKTNSFPVRPFFSFNYQSGFLLYFFLTGLLYAILLAYRSGRESNRAGWWLSLFVLLCSLNLVPWLLGHSNWYARDGYREVLFFVPFQQLLLLGPVLYMYVRKVLQPQVGLSPKTAWHFLPAALYLLYSLVVFVVDVWLLDEFYFYADGIDKDLKLWYQTLGLLSITGYCGWSLWYYARYRRSLANEVSFADALAFSWIRQFLWALLTIILLRTGFLVLFPQFGDFGIKFWYYFAFGLLTYFIAFLGYRHLDRSTALTVIPQPTLRQWEPDRESIQSSEPPSLNTKVEKTCRAIRQLLDEQPLYREPLLTVSDLATHVQEPPKAISAAINQGMDMNFNDLINSYRVDAVVQRLRAGDHREFTLLSLALDCGFNSKTTFNRAFKKKMGVTPRQFLSDLDQPSGKKDPKKGAKS
jgi:AraC-like DNA-binding protein